MNSLRSAVLSALLFSVPAFAYELSCIKDYSALDGPAVKVVLRVPARRTATVYILEEVNSRAASHKEESTVRGLACTDEKDVEQNGRLTVQCTGIASLSVKETEADRVVTVKTSYGNKSFSFVRGKHTTGPLKEDCVFTK